MQRSNALHQAIRSALADALVEQPRGLPQGRAQGSTVGTPQALPGLIPFGPAPPGMEQSSRFTGATAGSPFSLTEETPPDFTSPDYRSPQAPTPLIAALAANGPAGPSHGFPPRPPRPPGPPPPPNPAGPSVVPTSPPHSLSGHATHGQGGYAPPGDRSRPWSPEMTSGGPPNLVPYQTPSAALIAALAQLGQRLGTSRDQYGLE